LLIVQKIEVTARSPTTVTVRGKVWRLDERHGLRWINTRASGG